jgi:hypothetical protein
MHGRRPIRLHSMVLKHSDFIFFTICNLVFIVLLPFALSVLLFIISFPVLVAEALITDAVNNKLHVDTVLSHCPDHHSREATENSEFKFRLDT